MKNYTIVETEDGSQTYYSKLYNEACHSLSGAVDETNKHYIEGCKIKKSLHSPINILEVGFGVGHGFLETKKALAAKAFHFYSFEIDLELIELFSKEHNIEFKKEGSHYTYTFGHSSLTILLGDARKLINDLSGNQFHAIYQDAFSPKRNAILWTTQWFMALKEIAHEDCIMSTYSASSSIRKSMIAAGWKLYSGDQFGTKRSSTRAKLTGSTEQEILERLNRSHVDEITDHNYKTYTLEK